MFASGGRNSSHTPQPWRHGAAGLHPRGDYVGRAPTGRIIRPSPMATAAAALPLRCVATIVFCYKALPAHSQPPRL